MKEKKMSPPNDTGIRSLEIPKLLFAPNAVPLSNHSGILDAKEPASTTVGKA